MSGVQGREVVLFSEVNYSEGSVHLLCLLFGAVSSGVPLSFNGGVFVADHSLVFLKNNTRGIRCIVADLITVWAPVEFAIVFQITLGISMFAGTHRAHRVLNCLLFGRVTVFLAVVAPKVGYLAWVDLVVLVSLNSKGAGQVLKVTLTVVVGLFFFVVILCRLLMLLVALDRFLVKSSQVLSPLKAESYRPELWYRVSGHYK